MNLIAFLTVSRASLHNLTDAYNGSRRGLNSTMDMMNQLEVCRKFFSFFFVKLHKTYSESYIVDNSAIAIFDNWI
jgi:hypothetical protein